MSRLLATCLRLRAQVANKYIVNMPLWPEQASLHQFDSPRFARYLKGISDLDRNNQRAVMPPDYYVKTDLGSQCLGYLLVQITG